MRNSRRPHAIKISTEQSSLQELCAIGPSARHPRHSSGRPSRPAFGRCRGHLPIIVSRDGPECLSSTGKYYPCRGFLALHSFLLGHKVHTSSDYQVQFRRNPSQHECQIKVPIGNVKREHSIRCQFLKVQFHCFASYHMHRNCVGTEGIQQNQGGRNHWQRQQFLAVHPLAQSRWVTYFRLNM